MIGLAIVEQGPHILVPGILIESSIISPTGRHALDRVLEVSVDFLWA
jgi:hypothetical protein